MAIGVLLRWLAAVAAALLTVPTVAAQARAAPPLATCFIAARPDMTPAGLFARPELFDCRSPQAGQPAGDYWVLSQPLPAIAAPLPSVRAASVWQRRVSLYVRYADGAIARAGFTSATTAPHLAIGAIIDLPLPDRSAAPVRLLWHVEGAAAVRGIVVGPRLVGEVERDRDDLTMSVLYAVFAGLVGGLFIYNLALWGALRQRFQPAYCAMLACLLLYAFSSSGLIELLSGIDNNRRLQLNAALLALTCGAAMSFARLFFERAVFAGWLGRAGTIAVAGLVVTTGAYVVLAPWEIAVLDRTMSLAYAVFLALVPAVLWQAWRTKSRQRWLFALAWGAPIALGGVRVAAALDLVGWRFWIDNSTVPAMALEACLAALAIAARIRQISRERDEAREHETAARLLADTDPLTGLLNRRAFLAQAIGGQTTRRLVIVDIDHFKQVNDTIGHDGGDEVLRVVARTLRTSAPEDALVARMGGEEFALLVAAEDDEVPTIVLEGLRAARMPFDLKVTASIGACAGTLATETDWKALYRDADRALFEAMAAGRDRLRHAAPIARAA